MGKNFLFRRMMKIKNERCSWLAIKTFVELEIYIMTLIFIYFDEKNIINIYNKNTSKKY